MRSCRYQWCDGSVPDLGIIAGSGGFLHAAQSSKENTCQIRCTSQTGRRLARRRGSRGGWAFRIFSYWHAD
jgi:hypothetical protein